MCAKIAPQSIRRPLIQSVMVLWGVVFGIASADDPSPERGFHLLTTRPYLPPDFDQGVFDALWAVWPEDDKRLAQAATPTERRRMTLERYGLFDHPDQIDDLDAPAAGYLKTPEGGWVMTCFACHAGSVAGGPTIYGLPNSHTRLHSLIDDVVAVKLRQLKPPSHLDIGSRYFPLNETDGVTNAVVFGVALGAHRDADMNVVRRRPTHLVHHDVDAPPWWHAKKKSTLYADGFAPKNHRVIMQFMMLPTNDGPTMRQWADDFRHILAFIESVEAPAYPFSINHEQATRGQELFEANCTTCHGTYGADETYPERTVDIDVIGTDRVRLDALTPEHRSWMQVGWLSDYGQDPVETNPTGYVAPPLDGVWATAPYLHNGSVPTLWHLMHPDQRPNVWKRTADGYDTRRVGLELCPDVDAIPNTATDFERRQYHDTSRIGMSNTGHAFFDDLSEADKDALIEYLKTL